MDLFRSPQPLWVLLLSALLPSCADEVSGPAPADQNETSDMPSCFGALSGDPNELAHLREQGAYWVRPHPGPFAWEWLEPTNDQFDWTKTDTWVQAAQNSGVSLLVTIWPFSDWDQQSCHSASCEVSPSDHFYPKDPSNEPKDDPKDAGDKPPGPAPDAIPKSRCAPCNYVDYEDFLTNLIERYDGDGTADMPGLSQPVTHWEILNEPEMDSPELTFYKGTKEQYVELLQRSYQTIKKACPACSIVHGGAAGIETTTLAYWGDLFELGAGSYFDIANIHYISSWDLSSLNVTDYKSLLDSHNINKPIWVTESAFPSSDAVTSSIQGAFAAGASVVFFVTGKSSAATILDIDPTICPAP